MTPKISVIMTVHNGKSYIQEAVASILEQTYRDFELIVIDNGSTDCSLQIVHNFNDSRIKVIELGRNIGRTRALNVGVKEAIGKYIAIHDADDISLPQRFEKQVSYLEEHFDIVLLCTRHCYIDTHGEIIQEYPVPTSHASLCWKLASNNCIAHSSVMLRTKKIHEIGGYNENFIYSQDYHLYSQLIQNNEQLAALPEYLTHMRLHSHSMSNSFDKQKRIEESLANSTTIMNYFLPYLSQTEAKEINQFFRQFKPIETSEQMKIILDMLVSLHTIFLERFELQDHDISFIDKSLKQNLFELIENFRNLSIAKTFNKKNIQNQKSFLQKIFEKIVK